MYTECRGRGESRGGREDRRKKGGEGGERSSGRTILGVLELHRGQREEEVPLATSQSSRMSLATSSTILSDSPRESLPTSCTISLRSSSFCRICAVSARLSTKSLSPSRSASARAGNRQFGMLSALRADTKPPYKTDFL
jgi:hypothetical protein